MPTNPAIKGSMSASLAISRELLTGKKVKLVPSDDAVQVRSDHPENQSFFLESLPAGRQTKKGASDAFVVGRMEDGAVPRGQV